MSVTAIKERPILFSGPMVKAILAGRKTQTRRIVKAPPSEFYTGPEVCAWSATGWAWTRQDGGCSCRPLACPYGQPGDRLWVREAWQSRSMVGWLPNRGEQEADWIEYKADYLSPAPGKWRSPIHMPRQASRITLEITEVRVQRLQEISMRDMYAEGISDQDEFRLGHRKSYSRTGADYRSLWESIHGEDSWQENPWVWAITFKRVEGGAA